MEPPPPKRPRLKLNVRPPSQSQSSHSQSHSPDTIAVSRPRRSSSLRIKYSENMDIDQLDTDTSRQQKPRPSPAASSDLSSITSRSLPEKEPTPATEPKPTSKKSRDYSRDFMSYYVTGGDEDDDDDDADDAPPLTKPTPRKPDPMTRAPAVQEPANRETKFRHHQGPPPNPAPRVPTQQLPPPLPNVRLIDTSKKSTGPQEPDTVADMVKKLEALSTALTNFGGVPPAPKSPGQSSQEGKSYYLLHSDLYPTSQLSIAPRPKPVPKPKSTANKNETAVDNFLAMFDDEDSDDNEDQESNNKNDSKNGHLDYRLQNPGDRDDPLTFGVVFIQNALKSWAAQRLTAQAQQLHQQARTEAHPAKRGPGRPRKFDNGEEDRSNFTSPEEICVDVAKTPEYAAVAAFQDVIDCGVLQVNALLPIELSRALRHLYMQIDHLINQGSRNEPPWQCMSYGAQITAQKIRVDKWKDAQAKAQEEMARQQHLAQQQVMQQMGIPQQARSHMTAEQAQNAHAIELERRRSRQHAAQQPHLTHYLTNPLKLNSQPTTAPNRPAPSPSPVKRTSANSPGAVPASAPPTNAQNGMSPQPSLADGKPFQLDKMKLYMPNYLPRSGQSMKFSFAPHSELALKAFGPQAFPTPNNAGGNIPNRGPVSSMPTTTSAPMNVTRVPIASGPPPMLGSNAAPLRSNASDPAPSPPLPLSRSSSDIVEVAVKNVERRTSQASTNGDGRPAVSITNGKVSVQGGSSGASGPGHNRSSTISAGSLNAASTRKLSVDVPNGMDMDGAASPVSGNGANGVYNLTGGGKGANLPSRFPHPGAVVLDQ